MGGDENRRKKLTGPQVWTVAHCDMSEIELEDLEIMGILPGAFFKVHSKCSIGKAENRGRGCADTRRSRNGTTHGLQANFSPYYTFHKREDDTHTSGRLVCKVSNSFCRQKV